MGVKMTQWQNVNICKPDSSSVKCVSTACKKGHFLLRANTSIYQLFVIYPVAR